MSIDIYNVLVDFHCSKKSTDELADEFIDAQSIEGIGRDQHQVGYGVAAPNQGEAYRRVVDVVIAKLGLCNVTDPAILGATVYGPGESEEVTFD